MNRSAALPDRPISTIPALPGRTAAQASFELRSEWLHEVGWGNDPAFRGDKRSVLVHLLAPHLPEDMAHRLIAGHPAPQADYLPALQRTISGQSE